MSEELKQLPQSEEAEKALLGCLMLGGDREQEIAMAWVRDDDAFYNGDCKDVWKAFKELYKEQISVDFITVTEKTKEMSNKSLAYFITGLTDFVPSTSNVENYAKIVWQKFIQRQTAKSATKLVNASYDNNGTVKDILTEHTKLIDELKNKINSGDKVIGPFPLLPLIDNPQLLRKNTEVFVNNVHPKNNILPLIEPYLGHSKIRIGYFSPDLSLHPVAYLTAGLYEAHDRDHFEVYAFSFGPASTDGMSLRIKAGVDHFHNVDSMSHQEITLLARSLEIDVAVDLGGFTAEARPDVFAMSAAPIQLSYIGYLGTMGADYYDYLIADPMMIPKENQKYYSEKIVYLPSFQVNDSKDLPPEVSFSRKDAKLPDKGFVFCCFNNTYKITPAVFDSWARILKSVEGSVLIIYANDELSKTNLAKEISLRGVDSSRLIFGERLNRDKYLARYRAADLFLDTFPCNAGTTASDALKMGLPLLTLKGYSFHSREGASILSALNLPELITNTSEEYEALAIELATNPEKLKIIKDKLVNNLSTAPLYNTPLFTKNLETAYTEMYERHHKGLEPDHIYVDH